MRSGFWKVCAILCIGYFVVYFILKNIGGGGGNNGGNRYRYAA